jgi:methionine sulfoxide reductase heme-binding subunit
MPLHAGSVHLLLCLPAFHIWLDQSFDPAAVAKDIIKRPHITVGFTAFVLLIPLAATLTRAMMRRLGRHRQRLPPLIYPVTMRGIIHHAWLVKKDL